MTTKIRNIYNQCPLFFNFSDQKKQTDAEFSIETSEQNSAHTAEISHYLLSKVPLYFKKFLFSAFLDKVKEHFNLVNVTTTTNQILKHGNLSVVL